ncbi:MAG TPA: molybdenum cofactor biosynthesis protein MoaE [Propionibacteriaceae bacterium]|nr:molybdenum cofactor biosynthesis protein MoaE [Propionibacteriaceae bacterium]
MPSKVRQVGISESPLSVDHALRLVSGPAVGGIAIFVGAVRNSDHGADVVSLDYTPHPSAVEVLTKCAQETADHHDVLAIAVEHRVGHLEVGDIAVVVAVGAVHRGDALAACAHLINTLKAEVPIWKEQNFAAGGSEWVGLPAEDGESLARPVEARDSALRQAQGAGLQPQGAELQTQGDELQAEGEEARAQSAVR